jgi:hypothetical protein
MARGFPKHETPLVPTDLQSQQERKRVGKVDQGRWKWHKKEDINPSFCLFATSDSHFSQKKS